MRGSFFIGIGKVAIGRYRLCYFLGFYPLPLLFNAIVSGKSGAESGADVAQKGFATHIRLVANSNLSTNLVWVCAESYESGVLGAKAQSGEGGIRTRGTMLLVRRFSKPVLSATQPPLRIFKSTKKYTVTQED